MVVMIPAMIQSLVSGASFSSGSAVLGAAKGAASMAGGVAAGIGGAALLGVAAGAAGVKGAAAANAALPAGEKMSGWAFAGSAAKKAGGSFAEAGMKDLGNTLGGKNLKGSFASRVSGDLLQKAGALPKPQGSDSRPPIGGPSGGEKSGPPTKGSTPPPSGFSA
jgi:hypothetical protein